ncbi:MAG: MFS transporter [Alphaproteobacteria bacterium]|nr:MFS transporter [Alphaproteobacteria bacterium]
MDKIGDAKTERTSGMRAYHSILVLLLGFCAGLQLGKIAPITGFLQSQHGYSLTTIGWVTALIGVFVALAALPSAKFIDRIGPVSGLKSGAIILTAGAALLAASNGLLPHLAARTIEAIGYVLLVIAAPAFLATYAPVRQRPVMLALWGSFVPVGYALANVQAAFVVGPYGPTAFLYSAALLLGAFSLAVVILVPRSKPAMARHHNGGRLSDMTRNPALLALGFGIYVLLSLSFFTFLPTFINQTDSVLAVSPAAIALFVPAGNAIAALLLAFVPARHAPTLTLAGFALSGLCAIFLFQPSIGVLTVFAYVTFAFLGGVIASMCFGSVPQVASERFSAALVVGIIAQAGGTGTIFGPPLAGFVIDTWGWTGLSTLLVGLSAAGSLLMVPMVRSSGNRNSAVEIS